MKNSIKRNRLSILLPLLSIAVLISTKFMACSSDDPGNPVMEKLTSGPWSVTSVTVDGTNQNEMFTGFTITFYTDLTYTTTNGNVVWPAIGSWNFSDGTNTNLMRSDGIEVELREITETSLSMKLHRDADTFGPGRSASIEGEHVFIMEH
jgi:hypothetical protein